MRLQTTKIKFQKTYQLEYPNGENISGEIFEETTMKSFLTPQKNLKKVRKIGLQKTMVKVLQ